MDVALAVDDDKLVALQVDLVLVDVIALAVVAYELEGVGEIKDRYYIVAVAVVFDNLF